MHRLHPDPRPRSCFEENPHEAEAAAEWDLHAAVCLPGATCLAGPQLYTLVHPCREKPTWNTFSIPAHPPFIDKTQLRWICVRTFV